MVFKLTKERFGYTKLKLFGSQTERVGTPSHDDGDKLTLNATMKKPKHGDCLD